MAKAIKGYFGKRAASVLMKFIPGLNIASAIYDIGRVVAPIVLQFASNFWEEISKLPAPIEVDDRVRDFFEFIGHEDKLGNMTQALADKYQDFFESFNETSYQDFKTKLDKLQGKVVYKSVEDYLDALIEKKADFAEQMGSGDNTIKQKIKADYIANSAVINEAAQIITVKKQISFPHSNDEAVEPFIYCKCLINEKVNNTYKITLVKDINIKTKDGISWTLSKGEIAIYEIEIDDLGNKTETWKTISY